MQGIPKDAVWAPQQRHFTAPGANMAEEKDRNIYHPKPSAVEDKQQYFLRFPRWFLSSLSPWQLVTSEKPFREASLYCSTSAAPPAHTLQTDIYFAVHRGM